MMRYAKSSQAKSLQSAVMRDATKKIVHVAAPVLPQKNNIHNLLWWCFFL
jgi:hypothetical protein